MIKYSLKCDDRHEFEAWFASSSAYDSLARAGQLSCPACGSGSVGKAPMAPSILSSERSQAMAKPAPAAEEDAKRDMLAFMRRLREHVEQNSEYVGPRFAEEALKIHHEERDPASIYGEASEAEIDHLHEEGVEVYPLPVLPEDHN
jgi:hypothetical protein